MAPKEILEALQTRPFEPIRICMTDGQAFDLFHPEMCMVGHRVVILGVTNQPSNLLFDRTIKLDPLHIVRLEPLSAGSPKNGPLGAGPGSQS
jgi:hypothetical protein